MSDSEKLEFSSLMDASLAADYLSRMADGLRRGVISIASGERSLLLTPTTTVKVELEAESKPEKGKGSLQIEVSWRARQQVVSEALEISSSPREAETPVLAAEPPAE